MHESRPEKQQTIIRVKRVSNCYIPIYVPGTYTNIFKKWFSVWWDIPTSAFFHSRADVPHFMIPGIRLLVSGWWYAWYLRSAQETAVSLFVYSLVGGGITRTFRPRTHTSDDSYIYQLSLVVATATVSYLYIYGTSPIMVPVSYTHLTLPTKRIV